MILKKTIGNIICLVLLIFFSGCSPHFEHPLTAFDEQKMDISITGTWFWKGKDENGFLHIGLDQKSKLLHIYMVDFNSKNQMDISKLFGHTSVLGEQSYLNLKWAKSQESQEQGYIVVKYEHENDTFGIALMENDVVEQALQNGRLSGKIKKSKWSSTVYIVDDSNKLRQFVKENDKKLFLKMEFLKRLELEETISDQSN
ncbi:MAG: hypothetical protein GY729_05160 [Desulfobacteraceae bacterium]|nr:hypothetical protein [Desulfobacteraceae bacterium]